MIKIPSPLKSLKIKVHYSSDSYGDNRYGLIEDFFNPCLKNSVQYDRISAFYSSSVLIYLFQGIKEFIKNNGKMRLILGCIPKKDFVIINAADRRRYYEEEFIERLLSEEEFKEKDLKNGIIKLFAWMLDKGHLEIKLGLIVNKDGKLATKKEIKIALKEGMLHEKKGIFIDNEGFKVGFTGSLNETTKGLLEHAESISTFKSWRIYSDEEYNEHLHEIINEFDNLWRNKGKRLRVFSLPDESLKLISKYTPQEFPEEDYKMINSFYRKSEKEFLDNLKLKKEELKDSMSKVSKNPFKDINWYEPQTIGYEKWKENQNHGILAIATGVGKTLIAIRIIFEFFNQQENSKKLAVIVVPDNLALQWKEELEKFILNGEYPDIAHLTLLITIKSGMSIKSKLVVLKKVLENYDNNIIISYYTTFSKNAIPIINELQNKPKILLVADEVHEIGTKKRRERFLEFDPDNRLGLSATPIRMFDSEGTDFIEKYFKGTVYDYGINEAIKDGFLSPYNYYPLFYELTDAELKDYGKITKKLFVKQNEIKNVVDRYEKKRLKKEEKILKIIRKRIIKLAENKLPLLRAILEELKGKSEIFHTLIYVEDEEQLTPVINILENLNIRFEVIIQDIEPRERMEIIKKFEDNKVQVIVAERIFDQGINIEALKNGIILSSTVNKRQFIQRRGRLLRRHFTKDFANIYDFITLDKSIAGEIFRAKTFYDDCNNRTQVYNKFIKEGKDLNED